MTLKVLCYLKVYARYLYKKKKQNNNSEKEFILIT